MIWEKRWFQFTILFSVAFVWGRFFILMKIGLKSFDNNQVAAIRFFLASLVLLPYSIKSQKALQLKDLNSLLIVGFIGSLFPAFLFTKAQTRIDSSMVGMLNSLTPVFTLLFGVFFLHRTKFRWKQMIGLIIGLLGAGALILAVDNFNFGKINSYAFFIVLATIFYAININQVKSKLSHLSGIQVTSLSFIFTGPVALICLLTTDLQVVAEKPG